MKTAKRKYKVIRKYTKKEKKKTIVRDPQINKKYFISFFLNYGYNVLTKT